MNFVLMFGRHEWALALLALPETLIGKLFFLNTEYSDYTDVRLRLSGFVWNIN